MTPTTELWRNRALLGALLAATIPATSMYFYSPIPWDGWLLDPVLGFMAPSLLAIAMIPVGAILALLSKKWRAGSLFAIAIGLSWIGGGVTGSVLRPGNERTLRRTAHKADRVVEAIERFQQDSGRPPASIAALVPKYLTTRDLPRGGTTLRYKVVSTGNPSDGSQEHRDEWFLAVASATDLFGDWSALILDSPTKPRSDGDSIRIGRWSACLDCYEELPRP